MSFIPIIRKFLSKKGLRAQQQSFFLLISFLGCGFRMVLQEGVVLGNDIQEHQRRLLHVFQPMGLARTGNGDIPAFTTVSLPVPSVKIPSPEMMM
jgi:hypothetical protein